MNRDLPDTDTADRIVRADWTDAENPSEGVVAAVSDATERDPLETEPLQHYVDTEALDALVGMKREHPVRVAFTYDGLGVVLESSGTIEIFEEPLAPE